MIDLEFLATVDVCQGLNQNELEIIKECCVPKTFGPGERVYAENEKAEYFCFVIDGRIELRYELPGRPASKDTAISSITRGGTFGWSAFVPPYLYTLSCFSADKQCELLELSSKDLTALFEREPRIGYVFMQNLAILMSKRWHDMENEVARLAGQDIMNKW